MRRIFAIVALGALLSSTMVSAHEVFRIVGTIVKFEKWRLDVKTADGEMFLISSRNTRQSSAIRSASPRKS